MVNFKVSQWKKVFMLATCTLVTVACSSQFAASMRKVTYPPDFKYTEPAELRSDMGRLAQQMQLLDQALISQSEQTQVEAEMQRKEVLLALKNMERIATSLQAGDAGANHPFMQDYMQGFVSKIDQARVAASLEQPRYYFAGKVSGACTNCHKVNR